MHQGMLLSGEFRALNFLSFCLTETGRYMGRQLGTTISSITNVFHTNPDHASHIPSQKSGLRWTQPWQRYVDHHSLYCIHLNNHTCWFSCHQTGWMGRHDLVNSFHTIVAEYNSITRICVFHVSRFYGQKGWYAQIGGTDVQLYNRTFDFQYIGGITA